MSIKAKCAFCTKFEGGKCTSKGVSVEPHKKRKCSKYAMDSAAVFADEQRKVQSELAIPLYKKTYEAYEGGPTASPDSYVLTNRKTASVPKKLLRAMERLTRQQNKKAH